MIEEVMNESMMKKKYKILIGILGIEYLCILFLSELNVRLNSKVGNILGCILFCLPVLTLLKLISKDDDISIKYRVLSKIFFVFIVVCCSSGILVTMLGLNN